MHNKTLVIIIFLIFLSGCAGAPVRTNSSYATYFNNNKNITLIPIDIKAYQLTAGGVTEEMDEWAGQINVLIKKYIMEKLGSSPKINIKTMDDFSLDNNFKDFLNEQKGLYRAVAQSIILHTYMPGNIFSNKIKNFDYSLGSELNRINELLPTDSLLFVSGKRTYWTAGRIFLASWGVLLGAVTGITVVPGSAPDWIAVSLIDSKDGDIIWFRYLGSPNTEVGDLRITKTSRDTVNYLFKDLVK